MKKSLTCALLAIIALPSMWSCNSDGGELPPAPPVFCPDSNHPHLVDLGLPSGTKWSCCNVNARSPKDFGGFFSWAELEEKENYYFTKYKYWHYNGNVEYCDDLKTTDIASTRYDVARQWMGDNWAMPTEEQMKELCDECTWTWCRVDTINGMQVTGPNGVSLFVPATGFYENTLNRSRNMWGFYWTSTRIQVPRDYQCMEARALCFGTTRIRIDDFHRGNGNAVRAVYNPSPEDLPQRGDR